MIGFAAVLAMVAASAAPAAGAATGSLAVNGKSVALAHAIAFDAGAQIHLLVTDQALPPAEVSSEFKLAMYMFQHKVNGFQVTLDSARKVIDVAYHWELSGKPCPGCFDVTVAGGPAGPLTGTIKSTAKGEAAAEKLKVDVAFNAPFSKASAAKKP
jgi:hypothetical protein